MMEIFALCLVIFLLIIVTIMEREDRIDWAPLQRRIKDFSKRYDVYVDIQEFEFGHPELVMCKGRTCVRGEYEGIDKLEETLIKMYDQLMKARAMRRRLRR